MEDRQQPYKGQEGSVGRAWGGCLSYYCTLGRPPSHVGPAPGGRVEAAGVPSPALRSSSPCRSWPCRHSLSQGQYSPSAGAPRGQTGGGQREASPPVPPAKARPCFHIPEVRSQEEEGMHTNPQLCLGYKPPRDLPGRLCPRSPHRLTPGHQLCRQAGLQRKEPQMLPPPTFHTRGRSGPKGHPGAPPWPPGGREGGREACRRTWAKRVPTCPRKPCLVYRGSPARGHTALQGPPVTRTEPGQHPALTGLQSPGWDWPPSTEP